MKSPEILKGIRILGLTLYIEEEKTLVFGDLHLGYEEELIASGYLVPRFQYKYIVKHLSEILSEINVAKVVINGDLKHEFGRISSQEWEEVLNFLDFLSENVESIVLVKGNHDTIVGPIAEKRKVQIVDHLFLKNRGIYICHGHKIPEDDEFRNSRILIIGHDHPALALRDKLRVEKVKCFLKGTWNEKTLIQIPSLNFITEGSDITQEKALSPFMEQNIGNFSAYCVEENEIFYFDSLKFIGNGH